MALSDKQRFELNERIKRNPSGFAYLELRPDRPGGDFAIQGAIKLRSMFQILGFWPTTSATPRNSTSPRIPELALRRGARPRP